MRKTILLFDFDGTLVQLDKRGAYSQVAAEYGLGDVSGLATSLHRLDNRLCADGRPDRHAVFEGHIGRFKVANVEDLCVAFWAHIVRMQRQNGLKPDCIATLDALEADGYVLVCVTDTDGTGGDKRNRIRDVLSEYFSDERIFVGTEDTGYPKDRTTHYFEAVVRKLQVHPAQCIMIGDKVEIDLAPAKTLGMRTILVRNDEYPGQWPLQVQRLSELVPIIKGLESSGCG